jgi:hypothetical protein
LAGNSSPPSSADSAISVSRRWRNELLDDDIDAVATCAEHDELSTESFKSMGDEMVTVLSCGEKRSVINWK